MVTPGLEHQFWHQNFSTQEVSKTNLNKDPSHFKLTHSSVPFSVHPRITRSRAHFSYVCMLGRLFPYLFPLPFLPLPLVLYEPLSLAQATDHLPSQTLNTKVSMAIRPFNTFC